MLFVSSLLKKSYSLVKIFPKGLLFCVLLVYNINIISLLYPFGRDRMSYKTNYTSKLGEIISAQREFYASGRTRDVSFRRQLLINLKIMIRDNEERILDALKADLGKSKGEGYVTEMGLIEQEINHALRNLRVWNTPTVVPTPFYMLPAASYKVRHPRGLVMIFAPWNFPLRFSMMPLISSIAAGNCTIIKFSENSPATTKLLCELLGRYFEPEYVAVCQDTFEAITAIRNEQFGLVFYAGNTAVARIIMKAAAPQLTPVVLELGGKSPCIVDKSANLRLAAKRIVAGKMVNAGQLATAPDYLFVESCVKDELIGYIAEYSSKFSSNSPCENGCYPKIVNRMHFDRLRGYLEDGDIIMGGEINEQSGRISLTLMENINKDSKLLSEEIFGPILPVFEFDDISSVVSTIRKHPKPPALYVFTSSKKVRDAMIGGLDFGSACINDTLVQTTNPHLPIGGVADSGMGCCHGKAGFETFSTQSSVVRSSTFDFNPFRYPPYDDKYSIEKLILRYLT